MKVAFLTDFPEDPSRPSGGVQSVSVNLINALVENSDLNIEVLTFTSGKDHTTIEEYKNTRIHRLFNKKMRKLVFALGPGKKIIEEYMKEISPDVIHSNDWYGILVRKIDIPKVFTVHGFIHKDTALSGKNMPFIRSLFWRTAEISAWRGQDKIISISPYVTKKLRSFVPGERIIEIDNPVNPGFFNIPENTKDGVIFCSAGIFPRKNILGLFKALRILLSEGIKAELRIAGSIKDEAYKRLLDDYIAEKEIYENVCFLGQLKSEEIKRELSQAAVYALVSFEENSPMGIEEAMAAGVPVVASDRCGMPYMVEQGKSGYLIDPGSSEDIAASIKEIIQDNAKREKMRRRSIQIAGDRFAPESIAARTRFVYDNVFSSYIT
jgi:glycosyltransferase involved in cell wall biosynthesis